MRRSEIRKSEIEGLQTKVSKRDYGKYLVSLKMVKVRGFAEAEVSFDFPVTALVGPNGGGKTTVLGAAACAYESVKPRRFFAKIGSLDQTMEDWKIEYQAVDKSRKPAGLVDSTATFSKLRWRREPVLKRRVLVFGVARTVPAPERSELRRCDKNDFSVQPDQVESLSTVVAEQVQKILGKDVSSYTHIKVDTKGSVSLLTGVTDNGDGYSEFHFGAGESSVIRIVKDIEAAETNSLILIEEIENGLHPVATVRLVEYLIDVAKRKKVQAIFTTHANEALDVLPPEAVWATLDNRVFQGKLDIWALRTITGQIDAQLAVFVEDEFAATWVTAILRTVPGIEMQAIKVHALEGDGNAVRVHQGHSENPAISFPSVCVIDGDSEQDDDSSKKVLRLPGDMPEGYVFDSVIDNWEKAGGKLTVALLQPYEDTARVERVCKACRATCRDAHVLFAQIGEELGFIPESTVQQAFAAVWAQVHKDEVSALLAEFQELLPVSTPPQ